MADSKWIYERDECWGPDGEPLLSAHLRSDELELRVRNSRRYGLEVVVAPFGGNELHDGDDGPVLKVSYDDKAPRPLAARVQDGGRLAFVGDVRSTLAELNCTNQLRLHARPARGGVWLQLDASVDDLSLERLVEPAREILMVPPRPARPSAAPPARPVARAARPAAPAASASAPEASPMADLVGAVAPLAAFAIGAKLGKSMFGPRRDD